MNTRDKYAAFDLEIATEITEADDWRGMALKISCAAVALSDDCEPLFFYGIPHMSREACRDLVGHLQELANKYTILTWNGCSFDFGVLAQESGMVEECAALARGHVDLMLHVTFVKGWFLGFDKALKGAGLPGKLKEVKLNDGSTFSGMDGAQAPSLWNAGEQNAVLAYLRDDVIRLLDLADWVITHKCIKWTSGSGNPMRVEIPTLLTVQKCLAIPEPDTSWMSNPPTRSQFFKWMPNPPISGPVDLVTAP